MKPDLHKEVLFNEILLKDKVVAILLVEDNPGDVIIIKELLKASRFGFTLKHVTTLKETLALIVGQDFDIILLDLGLPDSFGLETLKKIQVFNMGSPVVVMTGLDDEDIALQSLREGAQDYLVKNRLTPDNILRGIKYGIERKKIQDLLKKNARQFSLLSATTTAINECEELSEIYSLVCRNIGMLIDKTKIIVVESDNSGKVHISGIEFMESWNDQIKTLTGLNFRNPVQRKSDLNEGILKLFMDGKPHKINNEFHDAPGTSIQFKDSNRSGKMSGINIYAIGFKKSEILYGGALICSPDIISPDDINIIETVINQVSLSLHRRTIERDLNSSKNKYKKLTMKLEMKVSERTRDLETLNYQLNQELKERHIAEEALKRSEIHLKELNATKDKFFNIIAHDLKNPFTCLLGSTELLNGNIHKMSTEEIRNLAQILNDSAKSGYSILLNLLDWSRAQTGLITINPEKINLKDLIDENISDLTETSARKGIIIFSEVQKDVYIFADKNMINTVLRNLLNNAIKFTSRSGTIIISAKLIRSEIIISVKDTGVGIPEDKITELFEIGSKFSRPGTEKETGTGLGLKLSKEFVELLGGKIWVKSIENKGSEFIFSVPLTLTRRKLIKKP